VETPRNYAGSIEALAAMVQRLEQRAGARATVGIGIPGAIVPSTRTVKNANSVWLNGRPLGEDLEACLQRPVRLMNDANCFTLSEATDGAAQGATMVFGVILGTGVGGGIVHHGRCHTGANLIGGEWGHNPLPWPALDELPGPPCYCGRRGCIETFLSGPGLANDHSTRTGETLTTREVAASAALGDPSAMQSMSRYHDRLARGLATIVNVLDPDVIVLGGGMSNLAGLPAAVAARLPAYVFSDSLHTRVVRAMHGDSSGVRGAAWLWE
jgi:fructokinase